MCCGFEIPYNFIAVFRLIFRGYNTNPVFFYQLSVRNEETGKLLLTEKSSAGEVSLKA
jgi:hypothetical protein